MNIGFLYWMFCIRVPCICIAEYLDLYGLKFEIFLFVSRKGFGYLLCVFVFVCRL